MPQSDAGTARSPEVAQSVALVEKQSLWSAAPTMLKATSAVVTALAALLGTLYQFRNASASDGAAAEPAVTAPVSAVTAPAPIIRTPPARRQPDTARILAAQRGYVHGLDLLLQNSGDTRGVLNEVLRGLQQGTLSRVAALSRIEDVIDDRRALLERITTQPTPEAFRAAQRSLRTAIALSIEVDRAALDYVEASFAHDSLARDDAYREIVTGSGHATAQKADFTSRYNAVRAKLGLGLFTGSF
jgi:hypothetical protein